MIIGLELDLNREKNQDMKFWCDKFEDFLHIDSSPRSISIAFIGKYIENEDAYISVRKAFDHCMLQCKIKINVEMIDSESLEDPKNSEETEKYNNSWNLLKKADGIYVAGGFGIRGTEGKIKAINYARENLIPLLGICFGFQLSVIEFCRNVLGWKGATTEEFKDLIKITPDTKFVVKYMPEIDPTKLGGTLRKGAKEINIEEGSMAYKLYGKTTIYERHRHRYEINPEYIPEIVAKGLVFTGIDDKKERMEILEIPKHPFFFGMQPHPELKSKIIEPSPCYMGFVLACAGMLEKTLERKSSLSPTREVHLE